MLNNMLNKMLNKTFLNKKMLNKTFLNKQNLEYLCKIFLVLIIFFIFYKVYILNNIEGFGLGGAKSMIGGGACKPKLGVLCGGKKDRVETKAKNLVINLKFILKKYLDLVLKNKDKKEKSFKASMDAFKGEYDEEKEKYEKLFEKMKKDDEKRDDVIITENEDKLKEIGQYIKKKLKRYTKLKDDFDKLKKRFHKKDVIFSRIFKFDIKKYGGKKVDHIIKTLLSLLSETIKNKVIIEVNEFANKDINKKAYLEDSFKFFKTLVKEAPSLFKMIEKHPLYKNDDFYKLEKKS